jgi:hypothetical protein
MRTSHRASHCTPPSLAKPELCSRERALLFGRGRWPVARSSSSTLDPFPSLHRSRLLFFLATALPQPRCCHARYCPVPSFFPSIAAAYAPCWHVVSRCALSRSSRPTAAAPHSRPVASSPPPVRAARPSRASLPSLQPTSCHPPNLPTKAAVSLSTAVSRSLPSFDFVSAAVEFFCNERPSISAATCADLHREHCRAVRFAAHAHATPAFASGLTRWRRQPSRRRRRTTLPYPPGSPPRCGVRRAESKRRRRRRWRRPRIEVRPRRLRSASDCLFFLIFSSKYRGVRRDLMQCGNFANEKPIFTVLSAAADACYQKAYRH